MAAHRGEAEGGPERDGRRALTLRVDANVSSVSVAENEVEREPRRRASMHHAMRDGGLRAVNISLR